jgi:hypothetical protein
MRVALAVVLFACVAAGAWLVFGLPDGPPLPTALAAAPVDANAATVPSAAPPSPSPSKDPAAPHPAVDADAIQRTAATPQFTGPACDVQVVHFETKAPIAEATVYCPPPDFDWQKVTPELRELARKDNDTFMRRNSLAFTTDADGRCRLPVGKSAIQITAVKGELWGQGQWRKEATEPIVIALRTDHTLRVRVVDAGGKPVPGSTVLVRRTTGERPMTWNLDETDASGCIEKRHVQQLAGDDRAETLEFLASISGGESNAVLVDVIAPPSEVLLQFPPGGTVTVRVLAADGKPIDPVFLGEPSVRLATFTEKPAERDELDGLNRAQGSVPLDARGEVTLGPVPFGRFVMASVGWWQRSAVVPGPTPENRHVEITVREGADDVLLNGTLLDAEGRPWATSQYSVTCKYENGMSGTNGRTDASGRFRLAVPSLPQGAQVAVSFDTKQSGTADPQAIEMPPRLLAKGANDLGEVRLARHSLLVGGKVVMVDGGDAVRVHLQVERKDGGSWQHEWNLHPEWGAGAAGTGPNRGRGRCIGRAWRGVPRQRQSARPDR